MDGTAVEVDLVGELGVFEDYLGFVTFLGREDFVGFGGGDGEGAGYGGEFFFVDETGGC